MSKNDSQINAALIIIGNEVLSGRTRDANLQYLAVQLQKSGIPLIGVHIIPDSEQKIIEAVNYFRSRCSYVFTTGGIGPTHDDITSASIAKAFGVKLHRHLEAERILRAHYQKKDITSARLKMAEVPFGAKLLYNPVSKAPGFQIENVFVLPGVPRIMQAIFEGFKESLVGGDIILSRSITTDLGEGLIGYDLGVIQTMYPAVELGSYPFLRDGKTGTSLVARHSENEVLNDVMTEIQAMIEKYGGKNEKDYGE